MRRGTPVSQRFVHGSHIDHVGRLDLESMDGKSLHGQVGKDLHLDGRQIWTCPLAPSEAPPSAGNVLDCEVVVALLRLPVTKKDPSKWLVKTLFRLTRRYLILAASVQRISYDSSVEDPGGRAASTPPADGTAVFDEKVTGGPEISFLSTKGSE